MPEHASPDGGTESRARIKVPGQECDRNGPRSRQIGSPTVAMRHVVPSIRPVVRVTFDQPLPSYRTPGMNAPCPRVLQVARTSRLSCGASGGRNRQQQTRLPRALPAFAAPFLCHPLPDLLASRGSRRSTTPAGAFDLPRPRQRGSDAGLHIDDPGLARRGQPPVRALRRAQPNPSLTVCSLNLANLAACLSPTY